LKTLILKARKEHNPFYYFFIYYYYSMGFLSFRKKSKNTLAEETSAQLETVKLTSENDNDSGVYYIYQSPIEDSPLMTGSSISDLTQSEFSDEIFKELPSQKFNTSYSSSTSGNRNMFCFFYSSFVTDFAMFLIESETSSCKSTRNSLSLKSGSSYNPSATEPIANLPLLGEISSISSNNNAPQIIASTEGLENTSPQFQKVIINKNGSIIPMASVSTPFSKCSPEFVIDRMKERHRQEYRRPIHCIPGVGDAQRAAATRRLNLSVINACPPNIQMHAPSFVSDPLFALNPIREGDLLDDPYSKYIGPKSNYYQNSHYNYLRQLDSPTLDAKPEYRSKGSVNFQAADRYTLSPSWTRHVAQAHSHFGHDACKHPNASLTRQHTNYPADISNNASIKHGPISLYNQRKNQKLVPGHRHEPQLEELGRYHLKNNRNCPADIEKPVPDVIAECTKPILTCSHHRLHQSMIKRSYGRSKQDCNHTNPKHKHCCCCRCCCCCYSDNNNHLQSKTVLLAHGSPSKKHGTTHCKMSPSNPHACKTKN
jgi:hypothetical protein